MKRKPYSLWVAVLACLAMTLTGCGKEVKVVHEDGQTIYDYSRKSEKLSSELTKALLESGVIDKSVAANGRQEKIMRLSSKEDTYLRWTITSYEAGASSASYQSLSAAVSRAARKANARVIQEIADGDSSAGDCAIFILGFSDRSLQGLATYLEIMQVVVPWSRSLGQTVAPTRNEQYLESIQGLDVSETFSIEETASGRDEALLDLEEMPVGAGSVLSKAQENVVPRYISKEPPLSSSERKTLNGSRPRLAIVIDDLGSGVAATDELLSIDVPLTVAVIPQGKYAAKEAKAASERGFAVLLHQPMEPLDPSKRPGKGGILMGMDEKEIRSVISSNLALVPNAIGVNNHMGSRVTEDPESVRIILDEVFAHGLFFFDSRTSSNSVVPRVAREMGLPLLENSRFLDHIDTEEYVIESIRIVARLAMERGSAAAIGHVRPATVRAIQKMLPELDAAGVELVTLDKLMPTPSRTAEPKPSLPAVPATVKEAAPAAPVQLPVEADKDKEEAGIEALPAVEPQAFSEPEPRQELEPEPGECGETNTGQTVDDPGVDLSEP